MMREYPAYGRTIASHIVRGQKPLALAVLLSARWDYFDHVPKVCLKPDEWRLGRYELGFVRALHAVAVFGDEATEAQAAELLVELMRVGPALLWAFDLASGTLHEFERAADVGRWTLRLAAASGALERLPREQIATAQAVMHEAQRRAAALWYAESERISARGDLEALAAFGRREYELQDRVRELFSAPWRKPSDARAA
jgi:hypothetical protein